MEHDTFLGLNHEQTHMLTGVIQDQNHVLTRILSSKVITQWRKKNAQNINYIISNKQQQIHQFVYIFHAK